MLLGEVSHPIALFSVPHIIFLAILWPTAAFLAFFLSKKFGYSKKLIWICAIIGLLCEIEKILFFIEGTGSGYRLPAEHIPINMCPFQIFLLFALALSESPQKCKTILCYMYPSMIGGGFIGMLIPSVVVLGYHGLLEFATYRYFFFHAMLIFLGFYLYLSKPIEFNIKSFGYAVATMFTVMITVIWLNAFFGWAPAANFCFFVNPPSDGLPLLNMKNGWVGYMAAQALICIVLFSLFYLPVFKRECPGFIKSFFRKRK